MLLDWLPEKRFYSSTVLPTVNKQDKYNTPTKIPPRKSIKA